MRFARPAPPRRHPGARVIALFVAVLLVLSGNAAALVLLDDSTDETATEPGPREVPVAPESSTTSSPPPPPTSTSTSTSTTAAPSTPLELAVAELSGFVADERELDFLRPVKVELLADGPFVERLLDEAEENREETEQSERVLRALQLIEPGVDLFETFVSFYGDAVLGFYDPETDELVLRGTELTPYVRSTLVHELTHALDDQHFELHRPELDDADDESSLAFSALVEGVAVAVETGYSQSLSEDEQEAITREAGEFARRGAGAVLPPIVTSLVQFPYLAGPLFVGALVEEGEEERVDAAFRDPPTTSEQILDPATYLSGEEPVAVPPPPAGGTIIDEGSYGQWALYLTLNELIDSDTASQAAAGWGGDSYVAWDEGAETCVRMSFAADTPSDLAELDAAWREWAGAHGDASVESGTQLVMVNACG